MEIQWVMHRQIVGFRRVGSGPKPDWVQGEMLATRNNGDEILFAPTPPMADDIAADAVPKEISTWIPISDFSINPFCLAIPEDFMEEEADAPPAPGPRPIGPGNIPRRREKR